MHRVDVQMFLYIMQLCHNAYSLKTPVCLEKSYRPPAPVRLHVTESTDNCFVVRGDVVWSTLTDAVLFQQLQAVPWNYKAL